MKVAIVGPGAIGSLFGALLRKGGCEVWLLDKTAARARQLARAGIRVDGPDGSETVPLPATADPADIPPVDLVCICVKAFDTAAAMRHAGALAASGATVASLQNGLGNIETIAAHVGADRALCAATSQGATRIAPGHVVHAGRGPTLVAPQSRAGGARARAVVEALHGAGLEAEAISDSEGLLWSKLVVNAAINAVTALWDAPNGDVPRRPELRAPALAAGREAAAVARAKGVRLLYDDPEAEILRVCAATAPNLSSMLQDVRRGRPTEIDSINGAVAREARALGLEAPVNADLAERVRRLGRAARGSRCRVSAGTLRTGGRVVRSPDTGSKH